MLCCVERGSAGDTGIPIYLFCPKMYFSLSVYLTKCSFSLSMMLMAEWCVLDEDNSYFVMLFRHYNDLFLLQI